MRLRDIVLKVTQLKSYKVKIYAQVSNSGAHFLLLYALFTNKLGIIGPKCIFFKWCSSILILVFSEEVCFYFHNDALTVLRILGMGNLFNRYFIFDFQFFLVSAIMVLLAH